MQAHMGYYAIGVDLGGTNLRVAAVDESGKLLSKIELETGVARGREHVIDELCRSTAALEAMYKGVAQLCGIGVGVPGLIDSETGRLLESPNLPGWSNYDVKGEIERRLGTAVILENDANAAALGEQWMGAGRDFDSMGMYTLGTGVGGGLVLNGNIWRGWNGMAGELGHCNVEPDGHPCNCGSHGCLEQYASATAVVRMAREALASGAVSQLRASADEGLTSRIVYECAMRGDAVAKQRLRARGARPGAGHRKHGECPEPSAVCHRRRGVERMGCILAGALRRGAATLLRLCRDDLGGWHRGGRKAAHHAHHASHAGRRRRTLRCSPPADDSGGGNEQSLGGVRAARTFWVILKEEPTAVFSQEENQLSRADTVGDALERVKELRSSPPAGRR